MILEVFQQRSGEQDGLYRFKKGFGGEFVELIGEIYIPFKPIKYFFYKIAKKVFCNLRYVVYKMKNKQGENTILSIFSVLDIMENLRFP